VEKHSQKPLPVITSRYQLIIHCPGSKGFETLTVVPPLLVTVGDIPPKTESHPDALLLMGAAVRQAN